MFPIWYWSERSLIYILYILLLFSHSVVSNSFGTPWTVAYQAPMSVRFPKQEYWSGLPFPSLGDLPDTGIKPTSPTLEGRFFTGEPPGKPIWLLRYLGRIRQNKMRNKDSGRISWGWTKAWTTNKLVAHVNPTKGHFLWRSLSIRWTQWSILWCQSAFLPVLCLPNGFMHKVVTAAQMEAI